MGIAFTGAHIAAANVLVDPSTAAGQFIAVCFVDDDNPINPITMPTGSWIQGLNVYQGGDGGNAVFSYVVSSVGGGGNLTFSGSSGNGTCMVGAAYTGVDPTTPIHKIASTNATHTGSGTAWSVVAPVVTTTVSGCQILYLIMQDTDSVSGSVSAATLGGFSTRGIANNATPWNAAVLLDANQATAGSTGTPTIGLTLATGATGGWVVMTVALLPATGGASVSDPPWGAAHRMRRNTLLRMSPARERVTYAGRAFERKGERRIFQAA